MCFQKKVMDTEEILNDLDPLYEAAMKEQRDIQAGIDYLTKSAKNFVGIQYTEEIKHLSAAGYSKLESVIYRHTDALSIEITNVLYHYSEK